MDNEKEAKNLNNEDKVEGERESKVALKNNGSQEILFYKSDVYGYSLEYKGIDKKYIYNDNDGKNIMFFPNQSYIDNLEIVDSFYVPANHISLIGTVKFGEISYKKYKDNMNQRQTYYLKTGLKNNKAVFIGIEGDSDIPNYIDLSSLKINLNTSSEESSTEVFKMQPGEIKSLKPELGTRWILAVDLLTYNSDWFPGNDILVDFLLIKIQKLEV